MTNFDSYAGLPGKWLKNRREKMDLTQKELADKVGCSVIMIRKIEAGERRPSKQVAEKLAQHLAIAGYQRLAFQKFLRSGPVAAWLPDEALLIASQFSF